MSNPWDVRPRSPKGDTDPSGIFASVGEALTVWETLESELAELFDALVSNAPSNRAAFSAYIAVVSSSARTQMLSATIPMAFEVINPCRAEAEDLLDSVSKFGARRNEIAHGRVFDLGEHGFYLAPNNVNPNKWNKESGIAKYQYTHADLHYYINEFAELLSRCKALVSSVSGQGRP